jgi:site-specific recombinase XerC
VLARICCRYACSPVQKKAIQVEDIIAMVATLPINLRGLRDRAILLLGYAEELRRSGIVSLDVHKDDTPNSGGWVETLEGGALLTLDPKTGWREVEIGRGSGPQTCPVHALEHWLHFSRIDFGLVFVRTSRGCNASGVKLNHRQLQPAPCGLRQKSHMMRDD